MTRRWRGQVCGTAVYFYVMEQSWQFHMKIQIVSWPHINAIIPSQTNRTSHGLFTNDMQDSCHSFNEVTLYCPIPTLVSKGGSQLGGLEKMIFLPHVLWYFSRDTLQVCAPLPTIKCSIGFLPFPIFPSWSLTVLPVNTSQILVLEFVYGEIPT